MEKVQFDVLVENVVRVVGDGLCKKYNVAWSKGWESALYDRYESERQVIRKTMQLNPSLGEHRIDRHKIASALARSILDKSPLAAKGLAPNPGARIANELLAIGCALQVVMHFVEQILADVSLHELQKLKNRNFTFPSAHEGHYILHLAKAFYRTRATGFDVYLVANIFFILETMHLQTCGVCCPKLRATKTERLEN